MTEQTIDHMRTFFYEAVREAYDAMDFALAVFDPKGLDGQPIEIDEKHKKIACVRLEKASGDLRNALAQYEFSRVDGGGMVKVIKPGPLE
jgi:hypothetical protein